MTKYNKNKFVETEAACFEDDSSDTEETDVLHLHPEPRTYTEGGFEDDSSDDVYLYDYNDGFLVPDDEIEEDHTTPNSLEDEIEFEKKRADVALDEVYILRKRLKTFKRKLKTMSLEKKKWERRAKRSKSTHSKV